MREQAVIRMLDGAVRYGGVEPAPDAVSADSRSSGKDQLSLYSGNGGDHLPIKMDSVKAIYIGCNAESEPHIGVRFFDSAPIPSSIWVRVALADRDVMGGMIANAWFAFSGPLLHLHLPGQIFGCKEVLIPRTSIAELQVITTR